MLAAVGNARFLSEAIDPTLGKESAKMGSTAASWTTPAEFVAAPSWDVALSVESSDRRIARSCGRDHIRDQPHHLWVATASARSTERGLRSTAYMNFAGNAVIWMRLA